MFFDWSQFDLIAYLKQGKNDENEYNYTNRNNFLLSQLIALEIDKGNDELIDLVKEIICSDNNVYILTYSLIRGVAMSSNEELHQ